MASPFCCSCAHVLLLHILAAVHAGIKWTRNQITRPAATAGVSLPVSRSLSLVCSLSSNPWREMGETEESAGGSLSTERSPLLA